MQFAQRQLGQYIQLSIRKVIYKWFERDMVVCARRAELSISEMADLLGFSCKPSLGFENCQKKRKYPSSGSSVSENGW